MRASFIGNRPILPAAAQQTQFSHTLNYAPYSTKKGEKKLFFWGGGRFYVGETLTAMPPNQVGSNRT